MAHDFKKFPELTNSQMEVYYFESPHKQITESFRATVVKVTDGDTIRVSCDFRNFDFPVRFLDIAAPELKEKGGKEAQSWLENQILGENVDVIIDPNIRVEKWGRLIAEIFHGGRNMNDEVIRTGHAVRWEDRKKNKMPNFGAELDEIEEKWQIS